MNKHPFTIVIRSLTSADVDLKHSGKRDSCFTPGLFLDSLCATGKTGIFIRATCFRTGTSSPLKPV